MQELASGDGWLPNLTPPDTPPADVEWLTARVDMPIKCLRPGLNRGRSLTCREVISTPRASRRPIRSPFARMTKSDRLSFRIDASHSPNVTGPEALALLQRSLPEVASVRQHPAPHTD
jgi:hypothetical protein